MSWPNLFLFAAPRSGSTQLCRWLASHPDVGVPPIKEPNHFSAHEFDTEYVRRSHLNDVDPARYVARRRRKPAQFAVFRDADQYRALFAPLATRWRCDASTSYLACPEAPQLIRAACGTSVSAISLTRDPVARAVSHYRLAIRTGRTAASLAEELASEAAGQVPLAARYLLRPSRQAGGVARVSAAFGQRHLALRFEDMTRDPAGCLERVARFLKVDPDGFDLGARARNASQTARLPALNRWLYRCGAKSFLRRHSPPALKAPLRRLYFRDTLAGDVTGAERRALEDALSGEPAFAA